MHNGNTRKRRKSEQKKYLKTMTLIPQINVRYQTDPESSEKPSMINAQNENNNNKLYLGISFSNDRKSKVKNRKNTYRGTNIRITSTFSSEPCKQKRKTSDYLQCWKKKTHQLRFLLPGEIILQKWRQNEGFLGQTKIERLCCQ